MKNPIMRRVVRAALLCMLLLGALSFLQRTVPSAHASGTDPLIPSGFDNFNRANQAHWGNSSDGQGAWQGDVGAGGNSSFTISSNAGVIYNCNCNAYGLLGLSDGDTDVYAEMTPPDLSGGGELMGVLAQWQDSSHFYYAALDGSELFIYLVIPTIDAGEIAHTSFTTTSGHTYGIRFDVVQGTLEAKAWDVTAGGEPSSWMVTATDTNYTFGASGIYAGMGTTHTGSYNMFGSNVVEDATASLDYERIPFASDEFARDDQTGWGSFDDGFNSWHGCINGSPASISGEQGILTSAGGGTCNGDTQVSVSNADIFTTVQATTLGTNDRFGLIARKQSGVASSYNLVFDGSTLALKKNVSGTVTTLATYTISGSANTDYDFEFRLSGTTLQANVWDASTAEPSSWEINTTDSTFSSGAVGVLTFTQTVGNVVTFEHFDAYAL